jgi:hypothetical protein
MIIVLCVLIFRSLDIKGRDKRFWTECSQVLTETNMILKPGYKIEFRKYTSGVQDLPMGFRRGFISSECLNFLRKYR